MRIYSNELICIFSVDSELDTEESPTKDEMVSMDSPFTSSSTSEINHHLPDGVVDSGVDSSESTTTPSSPEDGISKEVSDLRESDEAHKVDSDVMETAEMLLSLSGSNNLAATCATTKTNSLNGSNNDNKIPSSCRLGLKDEFIKSLRLKKKETIKGASTQEAIESEESKGRNSTKCSYTQF